MNPMQLLGAKDQIRKFRERHPKFLSFLKHIREKMTEDSVIEVKLTNPDGYSAKTNVKLTKEDMEILSKFF